MYHLAAYQAALNTATLTAIQALTDDVLTIISTGFRLPNPMHLLAAEAQSLTIARANLTSPTLRIYGPQEVFALGSSSVALTPTALADYTDQPFPLPAGEQIDFQMSNSAGGSEQMFGLIWVTQQFVPIPPGQIYWINATSSTACTARTWTSQTLTFSTSLPSGYYSLVGSQHFSTTGIAHRFIIPGQVWRPGQLSQATIAGLPWRGQVLGWCGEMGRFVNDNPPQAQVLANGTDSTHTYKLGLVRVGSL